MSKIWQYETKPAPAAAPASQWPESSTVPRFPGRYTLVMLAHPKCPCTRASLTELARLMAHVGSSVSACVLFCKLPHTPADWEKTALYRQAAGIPNVQVMTDAGGREAQRFHAGASGQTFLYDPQGRLLFRGGITFARGHAGDNAGSDSIRAWIDRQRAEHSVTPVFGCSLWNTERN